MVVGLGTGSTVAYIIRELGRRVREEGVEILGIVTSYQSEMLAIEAGIPLTILAQHSEPDLAIDGADQIDSNLYAIKGGGAAHTREKIVSVSAKRFLVVADESKKNVQLDKAVPVELLPYRAAHLFLTGRLQPENVLLKPILSFLAYELLPRL